MLQSVSSWIKTPCRTVISGLVASCSQRTFYHTRKKTRSIASETSSRATRTSQGFSDPLLTICFASFWVRREWLFSFGNTASRASLTWGMLQTGLDEGMLQSGLDECLQWYSSLANDIVVHQTQEGFDAQLSASSLDEQERQRQQTRREALQKARDALRLGAALAQERDDRKRSYDDMSDAEQQTLEDYETGRTKKAKQGLTIPRMKRFRCKLELDD